MGPIWYTRRLYTILHWSNGRICKILMASYPQFFWFHYVQGSLRSNPGYFEQNSSGRFFLNRHKVKIPIRAHAKLQKLMLGAESKLHAIFSTDFISLHQGLLGKKLWTKLIGPFFIRGPVSLRQQNAWLCEN